MTQSPAGWHRDQQDPTKERYWDGAQWTDQYRPAAPAAPAPPVAPQMPVQYVQAPAKKSHTVRNVILGIIGVMVLFIGGCIALIGGAANEIDKSIKADENQRGGVNNPIDIKEGEAFVIGDTSYAAGWKLVDDNVFGADIEKLKVTNTGDDDDYPSIDFRFWDGTTMLAEVSCGLLEKVPAGTSQLLDCTGDEPLPKKYNRFTVSNSS